MRKHSQAKDTGRTMDWKILLQAAQNAKAKGDYGQAETLFERALLAIERLLPADGLRLACVLLELSEFYVFIDKGALGDECFYRARNIMLIHAQKLDKDEDEQNSGRNRADSTPIFFSQFVAQPQPMTRNKF